MLATRGNGPIQPRRRLRFSQAKEGERGSRRIEKGAWVSRLFLNAQLGMEQYGRRDYSCSDMGRAGGGGGEGIVCLWLPAPSPSLPTPPPSRATGVTRGSNPPGWGSEGKGMRRGEGWGGGGGERITWPTAPSQLLERPLGEWTESFPLSPTPLIIKCP